MKNIYDLFNDELKEAYISEKLIVAALPEFIKSASSEKLKEALQRHLTETQNQIRRLEEVAKELNLILIGGMGEAMKGLLKEARKFKDGDYDASVKDAALIASCQKIKHYEISSYGTLKWFAKKLGLEKVRDLLEATSGEESDADEKLNEIAEGSVFTKGVNDKALKKKVA